MTTEEERRFKLVVLGTQGVGKSCLSLRFVKGIFDEDQLPTIGAAYMTKRLSIPSQEEESSSSGEKHFLVEIWDTAGQERYESITPLYYRSSEAALIVFDLTSKQSFEKAKQWLDRLRKERPDPLMPIVLVGNKKDLFDSYKKQETELQDNFSLDVDLVDESNDVVQFVKEQNLKYFPCSAKTGLNVEEIFSFVASKLPDKADSSSARKPNLLDEENDHEGFGNCC